MSPGELATCEDFLDGHREYAIDLLSKIEKIHQWDSTDSCPETREGRTCTLCELCSADGLMGATKKALKSYEDAENHLKGVRASLGKSAPSRGAPSRETLFKSNLAKAVFFCIATVGDSLRSQHATWQARLESEVAGLSSSVQSSHHINTGPGNLGKIRTEDILLPTYSGPRFVSPEADPKLTAVSTGLVPETMSSSSMFVVFRRCLSSDCPCEANRANAASNTNLRGACGSQATSKVPPSPLDSKKTRSTTTNPRRCSRKTSDTSDAPTQASTDAQIQKLKSPSPDARALDIQILQGMMPGEQKLSSSTLDTAWLKQEIGSSSPSPEHEALIVDPRVFRLRAQIARSDDARRVLMEWCRAWMANLGLDPRERHGTGLTHGLTARGTLGYPPVLALGFKTVEPRRSLCMTGQVGDVATKGGGDETTAQEIQFDSKQEELEGQWLTARQKRCKDRKIRLALV